MIGAIENAILARLKAASDAGVLGYQFRTLKTYGTDFDDRVEAEEVKDQWPAAWIVFSSWPAPTELAPGTWEVSPTFTLVLGARNFRNEQATRHGAADGAVGSYQLIQDAVVLLQGRKLGLDMMPLAPGACRSLFNADLARQGVSLFAVDFSTSFITEPQADADELDDFTDFHANWDVPPFGNVAADGELPDDAGADATDHVELPAPEEPAP